MITIYGIPNCDTMKKAQTWLQQHGVAYTFSDYRKQPPTVAQVKVWAKAQSIDKLLNKRSTTWKALTPEEQEATDTLAGACKAMSSYPTLIKRPLLEVNGQAVAVGFEASQWHTLLVQA